MSDKVYTTRTPCSTAWIFLCKDKPLRAGGGLGVAYNYLSSLLAGKIEVPSGVDLHLWIGDVHVPLSKHLSSTLDELLAKIFPRQAPGPWLSLNQALAVRHLVKSYKHAIVFSFTPFYAWLVLRYFAPCQLVLIHSEHSKGGRHYELAEEQGGTFGWREHLVRFGVALNFLFAHKAVFPSKGSVLLFQQKNPFLAERVEKKHIVIHNGVECFEPPRPKSDGKATHGPSLHVISIAHHVREKGIEDVIAALADPVISPLLLKFENFGKTSNLTPYYHEIARAKGIEDKVKFRGLLPQQQLRQELANADVFLHLPHIVVFDLSVLEAMMCGTPLLTYPLPGNVEALGQDYPLYAKDPAEISEKLCWIAHHPEEAQQLGQNLRARALAMFTNEAMAERYNSLFTYLSANQS